MGKSAPSTSTSESSLGRKPTSRKISGFTIEVEREEDGRWLAEVVDVPGVMAYGGGPEEAVTGAKALLLHVLADRLENGEPVPESIDALFSHR